jgi:trans-aconitate methyltransferase
MYQWNPEDYARHSSGQEQWARELIAQLDLRPDDWVLDVGCGDGRITAAIAAAVPRGRVVGVDSSADFIAYARRQFPADRHPNLTFRERDMRALDEREAFSVVFSNAAMHWVRDHGPVLAGISRALRPGGRCLLQMGGGDNGADVIAAIDEVAAQPRWSAYFEGFVSTYGFHRPDEYRRWLVQAGLAPVDVRLVEKDMVHADPEAFVGWLRSAWHPYTNRVPEAQRAAFIAEVAARYLARHPADSSGRVHVRMMRLQVSAVRPAVAA